MEDLDKGFKQKSRTSRIPNSAPQTAPQTAAKSLGTASQQAKPPSAASARGTMNTMNAPSTTE